jgi:hypothetical protein
MVYLQNYTVGDDGAGDLVVWYDPTGCDVWGLNGYFPCVYIPCAGFAYHMQADINK